MKNVKSNMFTKKTILNVFTQISTERDATKPDLCLQLWNHLKHLPQEVPQEETSGIVPQDVMYTLRRLIQGLGSARAIIRKSYFAILVSLLSNWNFPHCSITLSYFKSLVDKHLSKHESKGEEGEVLAGRLLAFGVTFRSKLFLRAELELQHEILAEILSKSKERSYLPLLTYSLIVDFIQNIDEEVFKKVVWPVLMKFVLLDWSHQSPETLNCLIEIQNKYPSVLKKKLILSVFGTASVFHVETVELLVKVLTKVHGETCLRHPVYNSIGSYLGRNSEDPELTLKFWGCVENLLNSSPSRLQQLAVLKIFYSLVKYIALNQIPLILTTYFADYLISSCRSLAGKKDALTVTSRETLQFLVSRVTQDKDETMPSIAYKILCRILFDSRHLLVDKITGIKVVSPYISKLDGKHVKLLAKKCENIVLLHQTSKEKNIQRRWNFKERCYAAQLLARLISHPESEDMDWKIKHLKLMMKYALFSSGVEDQVQMSNELASVLKNSFFTALSHQLSHLENHRMVLISLVFYIDNILSTEENQLRNPLLDEVFVCWKDTMQKIQKIDLKINKTGKQKTVMYVFHTLFLQMALHLFVDPVVSMDILNELDRCYKKEKLQFKMKHESNKNSLDTNAEPKWIEIAVELLLSLLSHDTYLLRQLISRIFPHLCPYLTAQATFQILQIFDPNSKNNILTEENESDIDTSGEDDDEQLNEDSKTVALIDDMDDESDSEVEDIDEVEESAIEKTRQAVRDALGVAGSVTDTESIDLDDIDEEEGRKLDMALSDAFRIARKPQNNNKNKKQSPSEKALTNFRIRVLDLVDIYLDNNPSLSLVLDTIPALFSLLEFCIKDNHQKPLESRVRSTLKKIGSLKKCAELENIDEEILADVLKTLMDKGVRTTSVFLNLCREMSDCCTFLLRMAIQIFGNEESPSSKIFNIFTNSIDNFFLKRDCLLPISLFENILMKTNWVNNTKLCQHILLFSFNPSVRGFRRNQGLILLNSFYKNTRLLASLKENNVEAFVELENEILEKAYQVLTQLKDENDPKLKASFISELFILLHSMKINKFSTGSHKWDKLIDVLQGFFSNGFSMASGSRKYMMKLCSLLRIQSPHNPNISLKRKRITGDTEVQEPKSNGFTVHEMRNDSGDDEMFSSELKIERENILNNKTVIKKKKSKRKTEEHFSSKKLRSELANDVEVLKFSSANILKT